MDDRRAPLLLAWLGMILVSLAAFASLTLRIAMPSPIATQGMVEPVELGQFRAFDDFDDDPRLAGDSRVWVVPTAEGWIALENRSPHLGCRMKLHEYWPVFVDSCHGQMHHLDGRHDRGPTRQDMRRLPLAAFDLDGDFLADNGDGREALRLPAGRVAILVADVGELDVELVDWD